MPTTIFLDIDGVLATEEDSTLPQHEQFAYPWDKECVTIFNELLTETDADIVLSSDWKTSYSSDLALLDQLFKHNGILKSPVAVTADLGGKRGKEIASYVYKNNINHFLILDDRKITVHSLRFVQCNINIGLKQQGLKEKCLAILQSDQRTIRTCLSCEQEYYATTDVFACSAQCRSEIEAMKRKDGHGLTDELIQLYQMNNRVVQL